MKLTTWITKHYGQTAIDNCELSCRFTRIWVIPSEDCEPAGFFLTNGTTYQWRSLWLGKVFEGQAVQGEVAAKDFLKSLEAECKATLARTGCTSLVN